MKCPASRRVYRTMNTHRKQPPKLDDLLNEIKKLSTKMKEGNLEDSTSSREGTIISQPISGKKLPRKRQKARQKKQRGRKRQLKYAKLDIDSSSFTDCTDEDIIRDYIENITANLSDSDVDGTLRNGAYLVRRDFSPTHDYRVRCSPEMDETDSLSESLLSKSQKKCRRYKRHSMEQLQHQLGHTISPEQKSRIQALACNISQLRCVTKCNVNVRKKCKTDKPTDVDDEMEGVEDGCTNVTSQEPTTQVTASSTENSESSSNSHSPGSEADDEGEESCVESNTLKKDGAWWPHETQEFTYNEMEGCEHSHNLKSGRPDYKARQVMRTPMTILCESGGFVAYANHKIKCFVYERDPNELTLHVTNKKEQEQVIHLAGLYYLQCLLEESGRANTVILTKTKNTRDADQTSLKLFLYKEVKLRCRKNHLLPQWNSKRRKINSQSHVESNGITSDLQQMDISIATPGSQNPLLWNVTGRSLSATGTNDLNTHPIKIAKRPKSGGGNGGLGF